MCGIVGYTGTAEALPILLDGMSKLEYRGYDSAGVAIVDRGKLKIARRAGKLDALVGALQGCDLSGTTGIGHTRWATHGAPTDANAHPHTDCTGGVAVVHNGIIENHDELRDRLARAGHGFRSETDTEVVCHLLESILQRRSCGLRDAVLEAVASLEGAFALVCIAVDDPSTIVVARQDPPIIVGSTDGVGVVASDIPALLAHTRNVIPLDNHEVAEVTRGEVRVFDFEGVERDAAPVRVDWDAEAAERGGFEDFMLKEIFEQPAAVRDTLRGRIDGTEVELDEVHWGPDAVAAITKIVVVACGTSYHAGMAAKHALEHWTRLPVELDFASEFRYRDPVLDASSLVVGIAQSGETADTLAAVRRAREMGARVVAITNVVGSSITRDADAVLFTRAGPEIGVAATKTFLSQVAVMYLIALKLGALRETLEPEHLSALLRDMESLPALVEQLIAGTEGPAAEIAERWQDAGFFLYLGRGVGLPVALEGALKLKEVSYVPTDAYAAGEMKHGPIALLDERTPVVCVATDSPVLDKVLSNAAEVRARGAHVVAVATEGDARVSEYAEEVLEVPRTDWLLQPVLAVVPLQLLAYRIARARGLNVDQPRNLAKTVTVE